jgi:hypothetical protein
MPQYYDVLDNGFMGDKPKRGGKKRAAVAAYLAKKGVTPSAAGSRSKREIKLRAEGREKFEQRKAVRKYVTAKGGKLSAAGERGKREMRLRAEGRAAYAASKNPKPNPYAATGGTKMLPPTKRRTRRIKGK